MSPVKAPPPPVSLAASKAVAKPPVTAPTSAPAVAKPMRAKLIVTDVSKSSSGVSTLTLAVQYDHTIATEQQLVAGANPKGTLSIEVSAQYADRVQHGAAFYLVSA